LLPSSNFRKEGCIKKNRFDSQFKVLADYEWALKCYYFGYKFKFSETPIMNFEEGGFCYKNRILARIEEMFIQSKYLDENEKIYNKTLSPGFYHTRKKTIDFSRDYFMIS
jgi:hypothetical protein